MAPFTPFFRNPHFQTIAGHYWPRPRQAFPVERRLFSTEPDVQVLVESQYPDRPPDGEVVMVHGLEGSSQAGYMLGLSAAAVRAGYAAHRFNLRTCGAWDRVMPGPPAAGGAEPLGRALYHGGLTSDLLAVLRQMRAAGGGRFFLVGFSLGGNIVLKLAGELGESAAGWIGGVCAVSPPIDLAACVEHIGRPRNWIYERRFVRRMRKRMRASGRFSGQDFAGLRSIYDVDDRITAPAFGFGGAPNYYRTQSAIAYLPGIRVPALLIQAKDDTFIPFEIFESDAVRANPRIQLIACEHGGHLGFLGRRPHRFWLDEAIIDWVRRTNGSSFAEPPLASYRAADSPLTEPRP